MKNENKLDEMVDILSILHQYVPTQKCHTTVICPLKGTELPKRVDHMHKILFGGDQLTVARVRGAHRMRSGSIHATGRLQGFIPVVEDWHAKMCLLEVCVNYNKAISDLNINTASDSCINYVGDVDSTI